MPLAMHDHSTTHSWASQSPHSSQAEQTCTIAARNGTMLEVQIEPGVSPLNPAFLEYLSGSLRTAVGGLVEEDTGVLATACKPGKSYIAVANLSDAASFHRGSPEAPLKGHLEAKLEQLHLYQPKRGDEQTPPGSTSFGNTSPTDSSQVLQQMAKNVSPTSALNGLASIEKKRQQLLETIQRQKEQAYQVEQFASRTRMDSRQQTYYNELNRSLQLNQLQLQQLEATAHALEQELGIPNSRGYHSANTSAHQYQAESEVSMGGSYSPSPVPSAASPATAVHTAPQVNPHNQQAPAFSSALQAFQAHVASLLPGSFSPSQSGAVSVPPALSRSVGDLERSVTPPSRRSLLLGLEKIPMSETIPLAHRTPQPSKPRSKSPSAQSARKTSSAGQKRPEWKYFASNKPVREAPPTWHEVALPDIDYGREGMPEMLKLTNGKVGARETNLWAQGLREQQRVHMLQKNRPRTPRSGDYSSVKALM